jgi:hypothetical protein
MNLQDTLKDYLALHKQLVKGRAGGEQVITPTPEAKQVLLNNLNTASKTNGRILSLMVFLVVLAITFNIVALFIFPNDTLKTVIEIVVGSSILGMLYFLRTLWKDKTALDILLAIIPSLTPEQVLQIVLDIYNKSYGENPK